MAKDTKQIIIHTLLKLAVEGGKLNIEELSKQSGITRNAIQKNFNNRGISGIVDYINLGILTEINDELFKHSASDTPLEIFADVWLGVLWSHHEELQILIKSDLPFSPLQLTAEASYSWLQERYEFLVKEHHLSPIISAKDLAIFWNSFLISMLILWLNSDNPAEPNLFRPKFLYLMKTSMYNLMYKGIGNP